MPKINNKTVLFFGILCILVAFGCATVVTYQMFIGHQKKSREVETITEKLALADQESLVAQREVGQLAKRIGKEIELQRLVDAAEEKYGEAERERTEGDLWIDREGGNWMITLGLLNGVKKGSRLRVYDEDKSLGIISVETALDVVSYVYPLEDRGQYTQDLYRVVLE